MGAVCERMNHDDDNTSSWKRFKTRDNGGAGPWSDLNHHVLYIVMMKLEIVDYLSFGGVCKSWRSLALSERNIFLASKPLTTISMFWRNTEKTCCIKDFKENDTEGRKFQRITLGSFVGGTCVGLTCGYLILYRRKTSDFWLVNPITRHQLSFTNVEVNYKNHTHKIKAILVFSRSVGGWVLVVMIKYSTKIRFCIAGTGAWNEVEGRYPFIDLCAFKGIMYTVNANRRGNLCELYELRLNREPKLMLIETKNSLISSKISELVCSGKNIYVMVRTPEEDHHYRFQELDFVEMKWVLRETTMTQYSSLLSNLKYGVVDISVFGESHGKSFLLGHDTGDMLKLVEAEQPTWYAGYLCAWYFPHECLNVDLVD